MPLETLEEVRLLSNLESNRHKLLQIVLFGQPELDEHLAVANMRQLRERITHSFRLEPLVRADIDSYVDFRMRAAGYRGPNVFDPRAMRLIARASEGLTRRINILADKALLAAFADGTHQVTARHARKAINDCEFAVRRRLFGRWRLVGAGLAAGLVVGGLLHFYYEPGNGRNRTNSITTSAEIGPAPAVQPANSGAATPAPTAPAPAQETLVTAAVGRAAPDSQGAGDAGAVREASAPPSPPAQGASPAPADAPKVALAKPPEGPSGPVPPSAGKLAQERFAATQQWLKTAPSGHFTIQLLTVSAADTPTLERFLRQAAELVDLQQIRVYSVKINGQQHYSATYGLYPSLEATIDAMTELPATFKARGPYHRSVALMRRQNQE